MPNPARIAFVAPRFPEGATVGGAETLLKCLARRAQSLGCQVTFLTTSARNHFTWENEVPPGERTVEGLPVHFFPADERRDVPLFLSVQERICRGSPVSAEEEHQWLQNGIQSRPLLDHLARHAGTYDRIVAGPYLFGLIHAVAVAHPDRTVLLPCLHDEPFAYCRFVREMFGTVSAFIFNSHAEADLARRMFAVDHCRAHVVGMGLDPFEADPEPFRRRRGLSDPYIVYSGRREPLKGTPLLLDYLSAFRSRTGRRLDLVLTGTGPVDPPPDCVDAVHDLGFVTEEEKHQAMAGALVFCHPSTLESLSIVLLESWMVGTPCLVHAGSAVMMDQCRRSGGGLWFRNYLDFEMELELLMDHPEAATALGQAGRKYVRSQYSWEAIDPLLMSALAP